MVEEKWGGRMKMQCKLLVGIEGRKGVLWGKLDAGITFTSARGYFVNQEEQLFQQVG